MEEKEGWTSISTSTEVEGWRRRKDDERKDGHPLNERMEVKERKDGKKKGWTSTGVKKGLNERMDIHIYVYLIGFK